MRRFRLSAVVFLLAIALLPSPTRAWTDGQPADLVLGQANFTDNAAAATQSGMNSPMGVAVDPATGKVFVADTGNNRVLRFASLSSLSNGTGAEGVLGQANFTDHSAAATQSGVSSPMGLDVDGSGRLWVADYNNNRVLRYDNAAAKANGANADGVLGQTNFTGSFSGSGQSGLSGPIGLAVDGSGRLWVADRFHNRVLRFDDAANKADGANADGVLGQPDFMSGFQATSQSRMWHPWALAADSGGRLWVADYFNRRVLRYDNAASKANGANADGVLGQATFDTANGGTTQSVINGPFGVAVDSVGRLWVNDGNNNRVLRFDNAAAKADGANADGVLGQSNFTGSTSGHTASSINAPFGLATDGAGNVWLPDSGNNRVLVFKDATQVAITRVGSSPTSAASVDFNVTFSSPVTGLTASNFALTTSGNVSGASITSVAGSGTAWAVTAATGSGSGTLRLDMVNSTGVQDGNSDPVANVPYTSGESYTTNRPSTTDVATSLSYQRGATDVVTFTLAVLNHGPAPASGTHVSAAFPALMNGGVWHWTCSPGGGATCPASGMGNLNTTLVSFPNGGFVTYTATSSSALSSRVWTMMATATVPPGVADTTPANNIVITRSYSIMVPLLRR